MLLHNIMHGMMSNVQSSFYLYDVSLCLNQATKNALFNHVVEAMAVRPSDVYKGYPAILFCFKGV